MWRKKQRSSITQSEANPEVSLLYALLLWAKQLCSSIALSEANEVSLLYELLEASRKPST